MESRRRETPPDPLPTPFCRRNLESGESRIYWDAMDGSDAEWETTLEILRPQLAAYLALPLPGAAAQRLFAPELAYGRHAGPPAVDSRRAAVLRRTST